MPSGSEPIGRAGIEAIKDLPPLVVEVTPRGQVTAPALPVTIVELPRLRVGGVRSDDSHDQPVD